MTAPRRIQLSRRKGWRLPAGAVKVDRTTPWGNVVAVGSEMHVEGIDGHMYNFFVSPAIAVAIHRDIVLERLKREPDHLDELRGLNLACWCKLCAMHAHGRRHGVLCSVCEPCHVDNLLELANR